MLLKSIILSLDNLDSGKNVYASVNQNSDKLLNKVFQHGNFNIQDLGETKLPFGTWKTLKISHKPQS